MRITNNQLAQGQMNVAKGLSEQGKVSEGSGISQKNQSSFSVGDRLSGTLESLSGKNVQIDLKGTGVVTVQLSGLSVNLMNALNSNHLSNQPLTITVELTGVGSQLEGKLLDENLEQGLTLAASKQILARLNLPVNETHTKAVALLNQYNLEPNSVNIKALVDGSISVSKLAQLPQASLEQLDVHMTIKEALVNILKSQGSASPIENTIKQGVSSAGPLQGEQMQGKTSEQMAVLGELNDSPQKLTAETLQSNAQNNLLNDTLETTQASVLDIKKNTGQTIQANSDQMKNEALIENAEMNNKTAISSKDHLLKMSEVLARTDIDKLAVLLKTGMPLTIKNALEADQILFGTNKMSQQLMTVLEAIEKTDFSKMGQAVEAFLAESLLEESYSNEEQLKKVSHLLTQLQEMPEASELKEALGQVKNSMEFIKEVNQNMVFVQLPVKMDASMQAVDLFIKKNKNGSTNQDELKLLIALNTESTGNVQAFIDWNKDRLKLTFKLEEDDWIELYKTELEMLQESLKGVSGKPVFVECYLKTSGSAIEAFLEEETSGQSMIDFRV